MGTVQTVFFDVDDTLFDRERAQREILRLIARELPDLFSGIDENRVIDAFLESDRMAMQAHVMGMPPSELRNRRSRAFLGLLGLDERFSEKITSMYVNQYPTVNMPVRGAKKVVEALAGKFRLGVISNGLPDVQYKKLDALGIKDLFDCIVLSVELGVGKPNPEIFLHAISMVRTSPEASLYVGDSYQTDVVGAKSAGMKACWFNPSAMDPSQRDAEPDYTIRALDEILTLLDRV